MYLHQKLPQCETTQEGLTEFQLTRVGSQQEDLLTHQEKKGEGEEPRDGLGKANAVFTKNFPCHQLTDCNYQLIKPRSGAERNQPEMV